MTVFGNKGDRNYGGDAGQNTGSTKHGSKKKGNGGKGDGKGKGKGNTGK